MKIEKGLLFKYDEGWGFELYDTLDSCKKGHYTHNSGWVDNIESARPILKVVDYDNKYVYFQLIFNGVIYYTWEEWDVVNHNMIPYKTHNET
jgi:hypothetical protein